MRTEKVEFENQNGHKLQGLLEFPVTGRPAAYALFAHCFTCSKNLKALDRISGQLAQANVATLRFDFTGLGTSGGDFSETNIQTNITDLQAAANFLKKEYEAPQLLLGHSLGGTASVLACRQIPSVRALVTIGAPAKVNHIENLISEGIEDIATTGSAIVDIGGRPFRINRQFIDELNRHSVSDTLKELRKAILILHSPQDDIVDISNAADIFDASFHPKSFISLDEADHLLTELDDAEYAGQVIASWAERYLQLRKSPVLDTDKQAVVRTGKEKYFTEIRTGNHHLVADEPRSVGGQDLGPSPYDLLASALGACTSMTLRMYADRKNWDLQEVQVHVQHSQEHTHDSENKDGRIDLITREIAVFGDLNNEQKVRLIEIANRCPVHRTLEGDIRIETSQVE